MCISRSIRTEPFIRVVLPAINLNDKPRRIAGEINYQIINGDLSTKVKSFRLQRAQLVPKLPLRESQIFTQLAGNLVCHLAD